MKKSVSFTIAYWVFLSVLFMDWLMPFLRGDTSGNSALDIGLTGIARVVCLGVIVVVLVDQLNRFSFIFRYERNLSLLILSFLFLTFIQIFLVDNPFSHIQGAVKYLFYFGFVAISWYGAIIHSDQSIRILLTICFFLFLLVLAFYPYVIITSGENLITRIMSEKGREHFLLQAANGDAHFMTTLAMLAFVKVKRYKVWCIILACVFYVALIYNGTRSALMVSFILPILFYILLKRKFVTSAIIVGLVVLLTLPYLATFIESKFEKDLNALENIEKIEHGDAVGASLTGRITQIWIPAIQYTFTHAPIIGFGSKGWEIVSAKAHITWAPHNFFVWTFVNWGLLGLMLIISIISVSIRYVWKAYLQEKNKDDLLIPIALLCAWFEFITWSNIANAQYPNGWAILCILIVFSVAVKYKHFSKDLISTYESSHHKHA